MQGVVTTVSENLGATIAGASSTVATLAVASQTPVPSGVPEWLPYLGSLAGPILAWVGARVLAALAARQHKIAELKHKRAAALKADGDKSNDAEADKLEDEADAAEATADALDAARGVQPK